MTIPKQELNHLHMVCRTLTHVRGTLWPKEVYDYNKLVRETLEIIKKKTRCYSGNYGTRVQEWKNKNQTVMVNSQIQTFLDRFYVENWYKNVDWSTYCFEYGSEFTNKTEIKLID